MNLLNPNAFIVRKNSTKPLSVLENANPAASNG